MRIVYFQITSSRVPLLLFIQELLLDYSTLGDTFSPASITSFSPAGGLMSLGKYQDPDGYFATCPTEVDGI